MHFHGRGFAVVRERDLLSAQDASRVLDVERYGGAAETVLRHDDVHRQVRPFQHLPGRADAADLDVASQRLATDADREHRHLACPQAEQRLLDRRLFRVGAVGHHHEAGQRQARELVFRALQRVSKLRLCAIERQVARGADAIGGRGEAEDAHGVAARKRLHDRAFGRERRGDELAARFAVVVGHAHAARVVQQDAEKVLLRHCGAKDENGAEETEEHEAHETQPQSGQDRSVDPARITGRTPVGQDGGERRRRRQAGRDIDRRPERQTQFTLLKDIGRIFEEKCKQRVEHGALG